MSYYMYKKKLIIGLTDGRILPLVKYSDSSVTNGCGKGHPEWWCINNICGNGIICDKQAFQEKASEMYDEQIKMLSDYNRKYPEDNQGEPGPESYTYYGNTYPGGGKMKNMRAFYSVRKTIPAAEYFQNRPYGFSISVTTYNPKNFQDKEKLTFRIFNEGNILEAETAYHEMKKKYNDYDICFGIFGIDA